MDVIAVTSVNVSEHHFPERSDRRYMFAEVSAGRCKEGADAKSPKNRANRVGGAPSKFLRLQGKACLGRRGQPTHACELNPTSPAAASRWVRKPALVRLGNISGEDRGEVSTAETEPLPGESPCRKTMESSPAVLGRHAARFRKQRRKCTGGSAERHSLFQEVFFFCTVKDIGDVPGAGCIYVETVVDRDAGIAFAKVYSAKNRDERRRHSRKPRRAVLRAQASSRSRKFTPEKRANIAVWFPRTLRDVSRHLAHSTRAMEEPLPALQLFCEQFFRFL